MLVISHALDKAKAYRERSTHANDLDALLQQKQLGNHQLQEISAVLVVEHVQLIEDNHPQISNAALLDRSVDQRVSLVHTSGKVYLVSAVCKHTFSIVQTAISVSAQVAVVRLPPK